MNTFLGITLLLTANLMLVASFQNRTAFRKSESPQKEMRAPLGKLDILDLVSFPQIPALQLIMPGTKWCGVGGNAATNFTDLGEFSGTDKCCRAHQQCEDVIKPIATMYSLENPSLLPKFNCDCEREFYECLKGQDDMSAIVYGQAYFGVMEQCFAEDYPAVECVKYQTSQVGIGKRCSVYKFDETKNKMYQYFDLPFFTSIENED